MSCYIEFLLYGCIAFYVWSLVSYNVNGLLTKQIDITGCSSLSQMKMCNVLYLFILLWYLFYSTVKYISKKGTSKSRKYICVFVFVHYEYHEHVYVMYAHACVCIAFVCLCFKVFVCVCCVCTMWVCVCVCVCVCMCACVCVCVCVCGREGGGGGKEGMVVGLRNNAMF